MLDITPYIPWWDGRNEFDARFHYWCPELGFGNYVWSEGELFAKLMTEKVVDNDESYIAVVSVLVDQTHYWQEYA